MGESPGLVQNLAQKMLKKIEMKNRGFTLIELMVTVAVIGILIAIALPSYTSYVLKSRRIDAKEALVAVQLAQEKYRGNHAEYTTDPAALGLTSSSSQGYPSSQKYYTIAITAASETGFTATATVNASSAQAADATECPSLTVNQGGFVVDGTAACWGLS